MATKKNIKKTDLISWYMEYVLEHDAQPKSVFAFAKNANFNEGQFYDYFGSFDALETCIFQTFLENTINVLHKSDDYKGFDARNQLLSFYFTFFENLTANRSYVVYALHNKKQLHALKALKELKKSFSEYVEGLDISTLDLKQEKLEKIQERTLKETFWFQLLVTIKFWLDDSSKGFEKTDIFIEKSVNASFDLMDTTPIKSVLDFGKFLFKEKMNMN